MLRFGLWLAAFVLVLDQLAKFLMLEVAHFSPPGCLRFAHDCGAIEISSIFDLRMVWNYGVSFGMLRAGGDLSRWGLVILSALIAGMFFNWLRTADRKLTTIALGLVIGGALGNMIDRIRFGAVADFFDFSGPWFGVMIGSSRLGFPWVFNVADAAITIGAGLLALDFALQGREARRAAAGGERS